MCTTNCKYCSKGGSSINIAIIDSNFSRASKLGLLLNQRYPDEKNEIKSYVFQSTIALTFDRYKKSSLYDLVIMQVAEFNSHPPLNIMIRLMCPVVIYQNGDNDKLFRIIEQYHDETARTYTLITHQRYHYEVDYDQIIYLTKEKRYLSMVFKNGTSILLNQTLKDFIRVTNRPELIRIHQSYIINQKYVYEVHEDEVMMCTGQRIPISHLYRFQFTPHEVIYV